jgi:hypothetical protein
MRRRAMSDHKILEELRSDLISFMGDSSSEDIAIDIQALSEVSQLCEDIDQKIESLYEGKFPKTCNVCHRVYQDRDDFIAKTTNTAKHGVSFTEIVNKLQEYRNCLCGSTLMVMVEDRRDQSLSGEERRQLFLKISKKIEDLTGKETDQVHEFVRELFKKISRQYSVNKTP